MLIESNHTDREGDWPFWTDKVFIEIAHNMSIFLTEMIHCSCNLKKYIDGCKLFWSHYGLKWHITAYLVGWQPKFWATKPPQPWPYGWDTVWFCRVYVKFLNIMIQNNVLFDDSQLIQSAFSVYYRSLILGHLEGDMISYSANYIIYFLPQWHNWWGIRLRLRPSRFISHIGCVENMKTLLC